MKKIGIAVFAALMSLAFIAPAFALENQFGGYFRVRMFNNTDFDGNDDADGFEINGEKKFEDLQQADTRTRLYYTALINDNLKFVSKFEMDAVWGGDSDGYGDIGADGVNVEVKNIYIDFNYGEANFKLGTQGGTIQRGFLFDDDFSGIMASAYGFTGIFAKVEENGINLGDDVQLYNLSYIFNLGNVKIVPNLTYVDMADSNEGAAVNNDTDGDSLWYLGFDLDASLGQTGLWGTAIYNGGESDGDDVKAFLIAAGFGMPLNDRFGLHGQAFYATGDDDNDGDVENFQSMPGQSYYWSEIMGYGLFDEQVSYGSCDEKTSNIMAVNLGVTYAATAKLKFTGDIWYAALAEDDANGEGDLGLEVDLMADYELVEGLNVKLVAAYLFAGDATTQNAENDENPMEIGTQFSIHF